jgi:predicted aldo/keto reductase-like oxidoreductase
MPNFEEVENYVSLSGSRLSARDSISLGNYERGMGSLYCRHACGICEPHCPHDVPINTIMRYSHYFAAQGREKYAMEKYGKLTAPKPVNCGECAGYCEQACPYDVPVQTLLLLAHNRLSL